MTQGDQLHLLFDEVAGNLDEAAELIGERAVQFGGVAHGTARIAAKNSSITGHNLNGVSCEDHVKALVQRLSKLANANRAAMDEADDLEDMATADIFTEIVRVNDKDLWFIEVPHPCDYSANGDEGVCDPAFFLQARRAVDIPKLPHELRLLD